MIHFIYRDHCFKDGSFTFLNPLTHRVQVCREVYCCREDTFVVFSFRFSVKLLPPFTHVVQFRTEVYKNFYLLSTFIQFIAGSGIDCCGIFRKRNLGSTSLSISAAPATSFSMSNPATAIGSKPTGVSTENVLRRCQG